MNDDIAEFEEKFERMIQLARVQSYQMTDGELLALIVTVVGGLLALIKESRK